MQNLTRRGYELGLINDNKARIDDPLSNWQHGKPVLLTSMCDSLISTHKADIKTTEKWVLSILEGNECDETLCHPPYLERLTYSHDKHFVSLGSAYNEGDEQEIETVMFDEYHADDITAEDLWMKVSWLSFHDEDPSLRFRFSFGVDLEEDVAADKARQTSAATLAECIFPESAVITQNQGLLNTVRQVLDGKQPDFVERILYFNAPNGGAYLHHDLERGHAGVVFAQLTGVTLWLALPQQELVTVICQFIASHDLPSSLNNEQQTELQTLVSNPKDVQAALNSFAHDALIHLINETQEFVQHLIALGHYRIVSAGDVILLPQANTDLCCWHSVLCLGDEMGEALSFAIR